jgi:hypothetical protein
MLNTFPKVFVQKTLLRFLFEFIFARKGSEQSCMASFQQSGAGERGREVNLINIQAFSRFKMTRIKF